MAGGEGPFSKSNPDTAVNRLIAEREEIEEQILQLQVR